MGDIMSNYELVNDDEVPEGTIIPEDGWALKIGEVIVAINWIKMDEEENEDGSLNVNIDYDVLNFNDLKDEDYPDNFPELVGDAVMDMLEQAMKVKDMKAAIKESEDARE